MGPEGGQVDLHPGDIVGEYVFDGRPSLYVVVQNFTLAPSSTETTIEALLSPPVPLPSKGPPGMVIITFYI